MMNPTILIIEDDVDLRAAFEVRLMANGFATFTAGTGEAGLNLAFSKRPDVILLDINLPQGDGFAVMDALDANFDLANIPVVVVTGRNVEVEKTRFREKGAQLMLQKPVDDEQLVLAARKALGFKKKWPNNMLGELVFKYEAADFIRGQLLVMYNATGFLAAKPVIFWLAMLYFVGGFSMLVLIESTLGFLLCTVLGLVFLLCPDLVMRIPAMMRVRREVNEGRLKAGVNARIRLFTRRGISFKHAGIHLDVPWVSVLAYYEDEAYLVIMTDEGAITIPRRAMKECGEDHDDFVHVIRSHMKGAR